MILDRFSSSAFWGFGVLTCTIPPGECPMGTQGDCVVWCSGWNVLYMPVRSIWSEVHFKSTVWPRTCVHRISGWHVGCVRSLRMQSPFLSSFSVSHVDGTSLSTGLQGNVKLPFLRSCFCATLRSYCKGNFTCKQLYKWMFLQSEQHWTLAVILLVSCTFYLNIMLLFGEAASTIHRTENNA